MFFLLNKLVLILPWGIFQNKIFKTVKPKVAEWTLQWRCRRRAQVQSYVNQTEMTSELKLHLY